MISFVTSFISLKKKKPHSNCSWSKMSANSQCVTLFSSINMIYSQIYLIYHHPCVSKQKFSVVDQEKIDKFMLELDGTENKCK